MILCLVVFSVFIQNTKDSVFICIFLQFLNGEYVGLILMW